MGFLLFLALAVLYFLPSIIAFMRGHHNRGAIIATNILLAWTGIGWAGALIWAMTKVEAV